MKKPKEKILRVKIPKGYIPTSFKYDLEVKNGKMIMEVELVKKEFVDKLKEIINRYEKRNKI